MNAARAGSRQTDTESAGIFGITAGHERGGFFMPHLNETDIVLSLAQAFHDSVDAVTR